MNGFRMLEQEDGDAWYEVLYLGYQTLKDYPISFEAMHATKETALTWFAAHPTYGMFDQGRLTSAISLRMPWGPLPGPKKVPHIGWFVTHPAFQGLGYAKKLLAALEETILKKQLKTPSITLGTAKEHPWLVKMYEGLGFVPFDTVRLPGKQHHTVYMEKQLKNNGK